MLKDWTKNMEGEMDRMVKRSKNLVRLIRNPRADVGQTPHHVVFRRNKLAMYRYNCSISQMASDEPIEEKKQPKCAVPLIFVPSLINRSYILDLQPGKSLIEYLVQEGFDVFLIDWGKPGPEDQYQKFDDFIELYLGSAIKKVCRLTGQDKIHLIGHCLGGMLTLTYAGLYPERIASLMNITTPFDLSHGGILKRWSDPMDVELMTSALGNAPWPLLQATFHLLKPMALLQKAVWFYDNLWHDHRIQSFHAMEIWSNDNVSIPGGFFRTYIQEYYQNNALYHGTLTIDGKVVDLSQLKVPVLNVSAEHDHIAPPESSNALKEIIPQTQNLVMPGGHIGAVLSRRASKTLWPQLSAFYQEITQQETSST